MKLTLTILKWALLLTALTLAYIGAAAVWIFVLPGRVFVYLLHQSWGRTYLAGVALTLMLITILAIPNYYRKQAAHFIVKAQELEQQVSSLSEDNAAKEERISLLESQFKDLMANPITFKQRYFLEKELLPRSRQCGIPDALHAGQWALESGRSTYRADNNYWGIGPRWRFGSLDEGVATYCKTVKNILKHKGYEVSQDSKLDLKRLQEGNFRYEGHNPDPQTYVEHVSNLDEFKYYNK